MIELSEIKEIIDSGTPDWVKTVRKYSNKLNVHINGIGVADYLNHIVGFENKRQYELRQKYATSNKFVFENLLRPVDKVFSSTGGSTIVETKTDQSKKIVSAFLKKFEGGVSIRKWIQTIQSNKYYSDPSGVVFFEWKDNETWPTLKSIHNIRNYEFDGRRLEWILFEPFKKKDGEKELPGDYYRFVDNSFDYLIHVIDDNFVIVEDETYENPWGYVPAIINSDILDSTLSYHISPIDKVVELADHYLTTTSVKNIYEFLHGYPIFWAYVEPCRRCDGTGLYDGNNCNMCDGTGHTFNKDVSDIIKLKPPKSNEEPKLAPDVAGYVQPDLQTWEQQRTELDWLWGLMHYTMWGTAQNEIADNETATAAFLDVQPVNDRLNSFADSFEALEKFMIDVISEFYIRDNYKGASVNYGRRYLVESPDIIWSKYQAAREKGSNKISLNYLLIQFFQTEFKNDIQNMTAAIKGMKHEPFVHKTDEEINSLPISNLDKMKKFYFNEFWKTIDLNDIVTKSDEQLSQMFDAFIATKTIENGQEVQ